MAARPTRSVLTRRRNDLVRRIAGIDGVDPARYLESENPFVEAVVGMEDPPPVYPYWIEFERKIHWSDIFFSRGNGRALKPLEEALGLAVDEYAAAGLVCPGRVCLMFPSPGGTGRRSFALYGEEDLMDAEDFMSEVLFGSETKFLFSTTRIRFDADGSGAKQRVVMSVSGISGVERMV
jgi:hypothetical protein